MVCGDFNARIGELNVLIDDDSDFFGDGVCRDNTRKSQDKNTRQDTKTGNRPRPKDSDPKCEERGEVSGTSSSSKPKQIIIRICSLKAEKPCD